MSRTFPGYLLTMIYAPPPDERSVEYLHILPAKTETWSLSADSPHEFCLKKRCSADARARQFMGHHHFPVARAKTLEKKRAHARARRLMTSLFRRLYMAIDGQRPDRRPRPDMPERGDDGAGRRIDADLSGACMSAQAIVFVGMGWPPIARDFSRRFRPPAIQVIPRGDLISLSSFFRSPRMCGDAAHELLYRRVEAGAALTCAAWRKVGRRPRRRERAFQLQPEKRRQALEPSLSQMMRPAAVDREPHGLLVLLMRARPARTQTL